ncbi:MAG TPA: CBS domain-containing protein [Nitrospirota bacterium]|nr:CBS domain-containing protein [Nitrospirota bacterium]
MIVKELLDSKGKEIISIEGDNTVEAAIKIMTHRNVSAVIITRNGKPAGIFTERDVLRSYNKGGSQFDSLPLDQVMTADLIVAEPNEDLCQVMTVMIDKGIRHMPVAEQGRVIGMLSIRDVVKTQVGSIQSEIHHLKDYVSGM